MSNCLFIYNVFLLSTFLSYDTKMSAKKVVSLDFEVYGKVQGVFFRKYTQQEAKKLDLKGWCMNTEKGTVQGVLQGDVSRIEKMKYWLQNTGSPSSRIDKAIFSNEKEIKSGTFSKFDIRQ